MLLSKASYSLVSLSSRAPSRRRRLRCGFDSSCVPTADWESPLSINSILQYPDPRLRAVNARIGVFDDKVSRGGGAPPW